MRATPLLLLGCLLGLGAIATAAANGSSITSALGTSSSPSYNCPHQSSERGGQDAAPSSGGADALVSRDSSTSSSSSHRNNSNNSSESDVPHFNDDTSPNHSSHGSGLSWQSLLPGSIQ
jgi:hypothetical protein